MMLYNCQGITPGSSGISLWRFMNPGLILAIHVDRMTLPSDHDKAAWPYRRGGLERKSETDQCLDECAETKPWRLDGRFEGCMVVCAML